MAKHSEVRRLPVKKRNIIPKVIHTGKKRRRDKHAIVNSVMIAGIYLILLKEYWLPFITE